MKSNQNPGNESENLEFAGRAMTHSQKCLEAAKESIALNKKLANTVNELVEERKNLKLCILDIVQHVSKLNECAQTTEGPDEWLSKLHSHCREAMDLIQKGL